MARGKGGGSFRQAGSERGVLVVRVDEGGVRAERADGQGLREEVRAHVRGLGA